MRSPILAAALVAVAFSIPAAAQDVERQAPEARAEVVAVAPQSAQAPATATATAETRAPTIHVTPQQIRETVRQREAQRENAQVTDRGWWWAVAAVAVGVIIALILVR